eukprot:578002-Pleurochrysis_carterae.AAC.2
MCCKKGTAKGATGKDIKLKLAVDFRELNAATELDTGSLGDQGDYWKLFITDRITPSVTRLEDTINVGSTLTISTRLVSCYLCRVGVTRLVYGALHPMA